MRFIKSWLLGAVVSFVIPIVSYIIGQYQCRGAGCAQAEFGLLWIPVFLIHTSLTMMGYYVFKKYKKLGRPRRILTPTLIVSSPINCFLLVVAFFDNWGLLIMICLLFGVCFFQSFVCDFYDRRQKAA